MFIRAKLTPFRVIPRILTAHNLCRQLARVFALTMSFVTRNFPLVVELQRNEPENHPFSFVFFIRNRHTKNIL